jgi:dihydrofolate synthase/folylpolyglutamate synthase
VAIFAVMADKDAAAMVQHLEQVIDEWVLPSGIGGERGQLPDVLARYIRAPVYVEPSFESAWQRALIQLNGQGRLLIFGSFFTVGQGMSTLEHERVEQVGTLK